MKNRKADGHQAQILLGETSDWRLPALLCACIAIVPFLWWEGSLSAGAFLKFIAIEFIGATFAVIVLFQALRKYQNVKVHLSIMLWPIIGFYVSSILSMFVAVDTGPVLVQCVHLSGMILLFGLVMYVCYIMPSDVPVMLVRTLIASAVGVSLIGLLQYFGYIGDVFFQAAIPAGTMINKNVLAQYIGVMLFPSLLMVFNTKGKWGMFFASSSFCVLLAIILITYTRGAWIGVVIGGGGLFCFLRFHPQIKQDWSKNTKVQYVYVLVASMLAFMVMALPSPTNNNSFQSKVKDVLNQPEGGSTAMRLALYANSWQMLLDHPLGVGLGNWRNLYPKYHQAARITPDFSVSMQPRKLHNDPFLMFVELGLVGGFFFVSIFIVLSFVVWKVLAGLVYSRQQRLLLLSLYLALLGVGAHSLVSFPFESPASAMQIWVWLAIIAGLSLHMKGEGGTFMSWQLSVKKVYVRIIFFLLLLGSAFLGIYNWSYFQGSGLEKDAYTLFHSGKCIDSLPVIDEAVRMFPYSYTANMRKSMYHVACDTDRRRALMISEALLEKEPYYLNLLIYVLPLAWEHEHLNVVYNVSQTLIDLFPELPFGYHWQGMFRGNKGDYEAAKDLFMQALEKQADFQLSLEMLELMKERPDEVE